MKIKDKKCLIRQTYLDREWKIPPMPSISLVNPT